VGRPGGHDAPERVALDEYRRRRDFARTPEPEGGAPADGLPRFVIQEHHARSLHWDLRLEHEGVLASWALPRGIPLEPRTNRLAVRTEDHPLAYLEFSGTIPRGEYGAGTMAIWDAGVYEVEKFRSNEVIVVLRGERVSGRYVLFQTDGRNWMIHRMDPPADPGREPMPAGIEPMLAKPGSLPHDDAGWAYEIKWDGVRAIAYVSGGRVRLQARSGMDVTGTYPELSGLGAQLGAIECVLDGEIVAPDETGRPSFERLQRRINVGSERAVRRLMNDVRITFQAFDVLWLEGHSTMALGYEDRRRLLARLDVDGASWATPAHHVGDGEAFVSQAREHGLEGVVAKRLTSRYEPGRRSDAWIKIKNPALVRAVIGGFAYGEGGRSGRIGSVLLGVREDGGLRYAGKAGSGISGSLLDELEARLEPLRRPTSPFTAGSPPRGSVFVEPTLQADIEFLEWTKAGTLRHPVFKALRVEDG
jgi:bifunctional non-homologous end joining protein LigD